jgi:molecular chaperone DnaK (HSP70)
MMSNFLKARPPPRSALSIIDRGKSRAQSRANAVDSGGNNVDSDLVISIDFGTTYTGVAYAVLSSLGNRSQPLSQQEVEVILDKLVVIRNWPNVSQQAAEKTPTILAYESNQVVAWGGKVKSTHAIQVAHFKLGLQENISQHYTPSTAGTVPSLLGGYLRNSNWRHKALPNKSAWDYTVDFLTAIRGHVIDTVLPLHFGKAFLDNQRFSFVLTVPAIWTDKAKDLTRKAAVKAGIPDSKLVIISEPEAAALYCSTMCTDLDLKEGDKFLICDAGGGTVVPSLSHSP